MRVEGIPLELRERRQWVVWRAVERDGKTTKVPYRADGAGRASSTDPITWATFEAAVAGAEALAADGIGFVFSEDDPFCGVDLDLELSEADRAAIALQLDSYTEESVSGGWHVIVRASVNGRGRHPQGLGVFDSGRYFVCTGRHVTGTPTTIEERQEELDEVLTKYLPRPEPLRPAANTARAVDLDDQELLEVGRTLLGDKFKTLWDGAWQGRYATQSQADLALCSYLAWLTGRDAPRIERMFSASGLHRTKWDRQDEEGRFDYRERTVGKAMSGTSEVYEPKVRPSGDALGTHFAERPEAGVESAGASLRPDVVGTQDGTHPLQPPSVEVREPSLVAVEAAAFAAVREASAEPLLGDAKSTILAAGRSAVWFGDGGAGKTTLGLDQAVHLCTGTDWLGLPVPRRCTVLWIENEGPRGKFREKLREKLAAWTGSALEGYLHVLERPWSLFTFADEGHRGELVTVIRELEVDVVFAGPVQRLGVEGGGTPAQPGVPEPARAGQGRPRAPARLRADPPREQGRRGVGRLGGRNGHARPRPGSR
jgi:putative DNA primase/helicase